MTIIWCGGEDIDFPNRVSFSYRGISSWYDSGYAREGMYQPPYQTSAYAETLQLSPVSTFWLHCMFYRYGSDGSKFYFGMRKKDVGAFLGIGVSGSNITLVKFDGSTVTTLAYGTSGEFTQQARHSVDLNVLNYGINASCYVYVDGTIQCSYTGDVSLASQTNLDVIRLGNCGNAELSISEVILADEDTRLMRLKTLAPNAAGDTSANWTGAYTDIDETTISDADKIYSSTNNADFQANLIGMPSGTWSVKAVKVAARCVDGSGSTGIQLGVKSGGTVASGDTQTASGYWQTKERLMQVNPVTGVAFTPAEIEALQVNLRAKTL